MSYNVLTTREWSLMKQIDWRQTQERAMSDSERIAINACAVKMMGYIAALDWFMMDLKDDLESEGLYRHGIKRMINQWTDKICNEVHSKAFKLLTSVNPDISHHYNVVGDGFRERISSAVYLEGLDKSYSIVINLCRLIEKCNNKIKGDYDFKPVRFVLELPKQLSIIGRKASDLEFIIENAVKVK